MATCWTNRISACPRRPGKRWLRCRAWQSACATRRHWRPSLRYAGKIHGRPLDDAAAQAIVADIAGGRYPDIHLSSFITACSGNRLDLAETIALTRAMAAVGQSMHWPSQVVVDKHCVGGLPGNRTTLLVVPIVAACGMTMPKTSSRAITSPAGTADTMETLAPVAIGIDAMRRVVQQEGRLHRVGAAA